MLPTIAIGDFILNDKRAYGWKIPFSHFFFNRAVYLTKGTAPERGDIIIFKYPLDLKIDYMKRVIGLPGDHISIIDNIVSINGNVIGKTRVKDQKLLELYGNTKDKRSIQFWKIRFGNKEFISSRNVKQPFHVNQDTVLIPKNNFFVMGDNRDHSSDSRDWGFVHFDLIQGRALGVWFNMVYSWSSEHFGMRLERIGTIF